MEKIFFIILKENFIVIKNKHSEKLLEIKCKYLKENYIYKGLIKEHKNLLLKKHFDKVPLKQLHKQLEIFKKINK